MDTLTSFVPVDHCIVFHLVINEALVADHTLKLGFEILHLIYQLDLHFYLYMCVYEFISSRLITNSLVFTHMHGRNPRTVLVEDIINHWAPTFFLT